MPQQLPVHPNLEHLKKQAKDVLRIFRRQKPLWKLADAQHAIARGYGFVNWTSLKTHVEKTRPERHEAERPSSASTRALKPATCAESPGNHSPIHPIHPIVGAWVVDRAKTPTHKDPHRSNDDAVVEFQVSAEEIKLTQVATDPTGREIAITTTIYADGQERPVPLGQGLLLKAVWATPLKLEGTFTASDQTVSCWSYEVSLDGASLVVTSATVQHVFKRL